MSETDERTDLRTIADYQFGAGAGDALFAGDISIERSSNGRPQQIRDGRARIVSFGLDGRFTLGVEGGRRLLDSLAAPQARVVVGDESEPFVRDGKNVFAKFVSDVDPDVRPGDEVVVVHEEGYILAVGRAELSASAMLDFETGMAVKVRDGAQDS
ncbi:PUA domain-containing protein [Haladaptatus sp. DYSN1]|uniref:PUA domain-containing protein n=1 Tax=unclassified Haladaptatus TaxID=2622732 RepID=UPI002406D2AB|nr:PUA domain-containing protein [Haladaptatus sp. DYSN1]